MIMKKFDYIIQNPPYKGSLHIKITDMMFDKLSDVGKMVTIQPSTWLINLREGVGNNKKLFKPLKDKIGDNVYKVVFENYNKEFGTGLYVPFSITYIDKKHTNKQ